MTVLAAIEQFNGAVAYSVEKVNEKIQEFKDKTPKERKTLVMKIGAATFFAFAFLVKNYNVFNKLCIFSCITFSLLSANYINDREMSKFYSMIACASLFFAFLFSIMNPTTTLYLITASVLFLQSSFGEAN